jgi:ArsR family transcriptional regulator, lead/cadmium/zinc/bismuth-responsive transcriptional repressor
MKRPAPAHVHPRRKQGRVPSDVTFERAAALLRAAGDARRLRLLHRLAQGEWCVSELATDTGTKLSTLSQQLRLLYGERIIERRREGKHIYYKLTDAHVEQLVEMALEHVAELR